MSGHFGKFAESTRQPMPAKAKPPSHTLKYRRPSEQGQCLVVLPGRPPCHLLRLSQSKAKKRKAYALFKPYILTRSKHEKEKQTFPVSTHVVLLILLTLFMAILSRSSSSSSSSSSFSTVSLVFLSTFLSVMVISLQQQLPVLDPAEQESAYQVLESINSEIPWRSLFQDDLCSSAPHGVACDYFSSQTGAGSNQPDTVHITELSFGYVSEYSDNPPCSPKSTLSPLLFTSFKYLRKLFFYKCFTGTPVSLPHVPFSFGSSIEELVFIENPALVGCLSGITGNFTSLRRLVLTGNGVYGNIPHAVGDLVSLQEMTLSRNRLNGSVAFNLIKLKKLRILDLSHNQLDGIVPESMGNLTQLLKLDLSFNGLSGKITESLGKLQSLEFLDLSYNRFGNYGVPSFLAEMPRLREVYLSGNLLGGKIPEIWEKLGGILRIGFSSMGLDGNIPASMGAYLRNLCYLGLDNNRLKGTVPEEFGHLEFVNEINLENNNLSGRVPFSAKFSTKVGEKLKLTGNPDLCVDELTFARKDSGSLGQLKLCNKTDISNPVLFTALLVFLQCFYYLLLN